MVNIIDQSKKIIAIFLIAALTLTQAVPVFAVEGQEAQTADEAVITTPTPEPTQPAAEQPTPTPQSEITPTPTIILQATSGTEALGYGETSEDVAKRAAEREARRLEEEARDLARREAYLASLQTQSPTIQPTTTVGTGANTSYGDATGDTSVTTGDANNTANVSSVANSNVAIGSGNTGGASIINSGNGSGSENTGSATVSNTNDTNQTNGAYVVNNLNQSAETGSVRASDNRGNTTITTGNANTTGTVITAVNTNVDGVAVAEFNVADTHVGDLVLDFGAGCVSGCGNGDTTVANINNGQNSDNTASSTTTNNNSTNQVNDAAIVSNLNLSAESGNNSANDNFGDTTITTQDANVAANVLTFANNNLAGNVIYGVVNIFGKLIGDIILPDNPFATCATCGADTKVVNTNNQQGSTNTASHETTINDSTFQANDATIENNLSFDANTGDNITNDNRGNSSIKTGESNIQANVLNVANSNISGGDWWIVLVNEAGKWVGKIMGAPTGVNYAGSVGSDFSVDDNGYITVSNNNNGVDSTNTASTTSTTNNTTVQANTATVQNNINLAANTGDNTAKDNVGNSSIKTGDANIVANLVNFVNNNISGGKVLVTVVNVFGEWMGDLVTPGQKKEQKTAQVQPTQSDLGRGGMSDDTANSQPTATNNNTPEAVLAVAAITPVSSPASTHPVAQQLAVGSAPRNNSYMAIAGAKTVKKENPFIADVQSKDKIRINLAWFILLLPAFLSLFIVKRVARQFITR
jgi:hypothetical protein